MKWTCHETCLSGNESSHHIVAELCMSERGVHIIAEHSHVNHLF